MEKGNIISRPLELKYEEYEQRKKNIVGLTID